MDNHSSSSSSSTTAHTHDSIAIYACQLSVVATAWSFHFGWPRRANNLLTASSNHHPVSYLADGIFCSDVVRVEPLEEPYHLQVRTILCALFIPKPLRPVSALLDDHEYLNTPGEVSRSTCRPSPFTQKLMSIPAIVGDIWRILPLNFCFLQSMSWSRSRSLPSSYQLDWRSNNLGNSKIQSPFTLDSLAS